MKRYDPKGAVILVAIVTAVGLIVPWAAGSFTTEEQAPVTKREPEHRPRARSKPDIPLAERLRAAVEAQRFDQVADLMPPDVTGPVRGADRPPRPPHMPNVDVSVIELDDRGRPVDAANVLLSEQYPTGAVVPVDSRLSSSAVRWRSWNLEEWNAGSAGSVDLVPGRENAPLEFISTYPASVMKLMVGFGVLRAVDRGDIDLEDELEYDPSNTTCGQPDKQKIRTWFQRMITMSDNRATCALVKMLHDRGRIDDLNDTFSDLGLATLQLNGTNPRSGGSWSKTAMTSLDTARLLLLVSGSPGVLWETPSGEPVTAAELSGSSRRFFYDMLEQQGLNQVLSTSNWCGRDYPAPGIPQRVHRRWVDPQDGTVTVEQRVYGQDVRPCNRAAEVTFAHKTGLTSHGGADAGIVHALPGKPDRDYIVVVMSNLGSRFTDIAAPAGPAGTYPVQYTQKFGQLGKAIDTIMTRRAAAADKRRSLS
ncbi:MAG TPA: serine hydrolase [Actinopolymorphaceae bacterium]